MRRRISLFFALLASLAGAQSVQHLEESPSFPRTTYRLAQNEGRDWPNLADGDDCTLVQIGAGHERAEVTVVSTVSEDRLLDAVRKAVQGAGLPEAEYGRRHGDLAATVKADFHRAMRGDGFVFPVARLVKGLRKAKLPKPLVVAVEPRGSATTLVGPRGRRELTASTNLFSADEIADDDALETRFHVAPWAPLAAGSALLVATGFLLGFPALLLWLLREKRFIGPPSPPPTPEETQAAYDARAAKPRWRRYVVLVPFLSVSGLLFLFTSKPVRYQIGAAMPGPIKTFADSSWIVVAFAPFWLAMLSMEWRSRRKARRERPDERPSAPTMTLLTFVMLALFGSVSLIGSQKAWLHALPVETRFLVTFAPLIATAVLLALVILRGSHRTDVPLSEDDPVAVMAREMAAQAGVKVRRVVERREGGPNAFAGLFGTVGITRKLRESLDDGEIRAVVAHEVGHLKASDPWRFLGLSLPPLLAVYALWFWVDLRTPYGDSPFVHLGMQTLAFMGLPLFSAYALSPRRRRAEFAADRFALETTGDVEIVARALVKIHDANRAPHRLHPRDERVASHPALVKRLERLREADKMKR